MQPAEQSGLRLATGLVVTSVFLPRLIYGIYGGLGTEAPESLFPLTAAFYLMSMWAWFSAYGRTRKVPRVMDMGWLVMMAWPVVLPYYIIRSEGRKGLTRIALFCFMWLAAWATQLAVAIWTRVIVDPG
jgi:hypothetical protein